MPQLTRTLLISNPLHGTRHQIYTWAKKGYGYESSLDTNYFDEQLAAVKDYFAKKYVKWWAAYEQTIDTDTGQVSAKMIEGENHEEAPLLEINAVAKGWKPAPKKPKKPKIATVQFTPPPPSGIFPPSVDIQV